MSSIQPLFQNLVQMHTRKDVLKLYKDLMRLSKVWVAKDPKKTDIERLAIREEVKTRFRANKDIEDETKINNLIKYTKDRIEIANHYKIPFERDPHLVQGTKITRKRKPIVIVKDEP